MRVLKALVFAISLTATALAARDAEACGGCFAAQTENTQVTGHRMILSVSNVKTTLWDQIEYSGNPASFGWVLPIKGTVDVGLSSDAMFKQLEQVTQVTLFSPPRNCPPIGCSSSWAASGSGGNFDAGVVVLAEKVVGPYQTVQLQSSDPNALKNWLSENGYSVPADVLPIIDAYVAESFNFLAMKLIPGANVSAMRPVRITTAGAVPTLPLRMVAAGTGAITPIALWVVGEGRYTSANMPSFTIDPSQLLWDWDAQSSNYSTLKQKGFANTNNAGWLTEVARPISAYTLTDTLLFMAQNYPLESGYGDEQGMGALEEAQADADALVGNIPMNALWITRMTAQLSRAAMASDLQLQASLDQSEISGNYQVTSTVGTPTPCPPAPDCSNGSGSSGSGIGAGAGTPGGGGGGGSGGGGGGGGGCAITTAESMPALGGLALLAALAFARRRRNRA